MAEPSTKRQKTATRPTDQPITDPRFTNLQSDPRYRLPGKKNKVKLDKRFSRALQDEDFTKRSKVDRYGRPLESNAERKRLKRKYEFDEEDEDKVGDKDEADDDDEVQKELSRVDETFDPLRDTRDTESSSDETSSDEELEEEDLEEEIGIGPAQQSDIPTGEVTSRIAIVNLDWDNIRAADLMAVFNSFLPSSGSLLNVAIYPSEFGKERLERENMEGPPKEIFANSARDELDEDSEEENDKDIEKSIVKQDDGTDFDSAALRRYQLERLRYFYCILTFSSPAVAKHIYDAVDGTEYLRTANFFDLRFVPDDTDFSSDLPREECDKIPNDYQPNNFVTDALQHSNVKLTWDAEDGSRKEAVARAFKGGRREIDENDLRAYLGSDSSEDEDDEGQQADASVSKKEAERQRMRALLGLAPEPEKKSNKDKAPLGEMQITFTSGLTAEKKDGKKKSVFENSPEPDETTMEKYVRKERERKQRRKEKTKATREGHASGSDAEDIENVDGRPTEDGRNGEEEVDLGFDDAFFTGEPSATSERAASKKIRKEERLKKKLEREAEEQAERKQRAELELLMVDDDIAAGGEKAGAKIRHFDMKDIERAEKQARKKGKGRRGKDKKNDTAASNETRDDFKVDTSDPRFARLFENSEYAIDPTNPRFKGTNAMKTLLEEKKKKRQDLDRHGRDRDQSRDAARERDMDRAKKDKDIKGNKVSTGGDGARDRDVMGLVEKIKRQTQR